MKQQICVGHRHVHDGNWQVSGRSGDGGAGPGMGEEWGNSEAIMVLHWVGILKPFCITLSLATDSVQLLQVSQNTELSLHWCS